jgi:formylglycine-generating enzyme required for sulfatase activity
MVMTWSRCGMDPVSKSALKARMLEYRVIVATALTLRVPVLSKDASIHGFQSVDALWWSSCSVQRGVASTARRRSSRRMRAMRPSNAWHACFVSCLLMLGATACHKPSRCPKGSVLIPAGSFEMGTSKEIFPGWQLEPRKVTLTRPYCMDRTEVTEKEYDACQNVGACYRRPGSLPLPPSMNKQPRAFLSWSEAVTFCTWKGGRLPTEAEWEFAARGTDGRLYPWGNQPPTKEHWLWPNEGGPTTVIDVGSFPKGRSFFGLDDMTGNLKEWVADPCGLHYPKPDVDPKGPDFRDAPGKCHITRGAGWSSIMESCASGAYREYGTGDGGDNGTGFRCAYDPT